MDFDHFHEIILLTIDPLYNYVDVFMGLFHLQRKRLWV